MCCGNRDLQLSNVICVVETEIYNYQMLYVLWKQISTAIKCYMCCGNRYLQLSNVISFKPGEVKIVLGCCGSRNLGLRDLVIFNDVYDGTILTAVSYPNSPVLSARHNSNSKYLRSSPCYYGLQTVQCVWLG